MNAQILINCGQNWFEFTKSKTGQLDYAGKWEKNDCPKVEGAQVIASSTYFTPSYYVYIQSALNFNPKVYVAPGVDVSDRDVFDYLVHVGVLLAAVDAKDSILAGELYLRRRAVFEKFAQLTQFILEPLSVEILFSLVYGRMNDVGAETVPLIFESARQRLAFDSSKETLSQAYMRYFKKNTVTLTLPLVGTQFFHWQEQFEPAILGASDVGEWKDIYVDYEKVRKAKHDFFAGLETVVQAEPYNPHDKNSILCMIENVEAKMYGNPSLESAGHIRALAAQVIREAKPKQLAYGGKLVRFSYGEIVVQMTI